MKQNPEIDALKEQIRSLEKVIKTLLNDKEDLQEQLDCARKTIKTKIVKASKMISDNRKLVETNQQLKTELENEKRKVIECEQEVRAVKTVLEVSSKEENSSIECVPLDLGTGGRGKLYLYKTKWLVYQFETTKAVIVAVKDNGKYRRLTKTEKLDVEDNRIRVNGLKSMTLQGFIKLEMTDPSMAIWLGVNNLLPIEL